MRGGKKGKRDEFHVKINNKIKIYSLSLEFVFLIAFSLHFSLFLSSHFL